MPDAHREHAPFLPHAGILWKYFWITWPVVTLNAAAHLPEAHASGFTAGAYVVVILLTHGGVYLLPVMLLSLGLDAALSPRLLGRIPGVARMGSAPVLGLAVLGFTAVQGLLLADRFIYHGYGFHLNAFVLNLVTTRGGIASLGGSPSTMRTAVAIMAALLALQGALMSTLLLWGRLRALVARLLTFRRQVFIGLLLGGLLLTQAVAYGVFSIVDHIPALVAAEVFPAHVHVTFASLAEKLLGVRPPKRAAFSAEAIALEYPLAPLRFREDRRPLNLVFLVGESWRWDMLDPEIMPDTFAFSRSATRCELHYSGGHGTRMGVFALFYGLPSPYWDSFLQERRGPVLMDVVIDGGYQLGLYTSATFSYPEFDRTVFARVLTGNLHEYSQGEGWERDRVNVTRLTDYIRSRDRSRPFMTFLFFESPHAHYHFPPECAIRTPYAEEMNYVTMNLDREGIAKVRNRYVNSCRHLDTQFARVFACLKEEGLLDSTIVVVTGDHGEEFLEKGRWGHNSTFSDEQTRTPLVLHVPGRAPGVVRRMTGHADVPATVLEALGVVNDPRDYSLGYSVYEQRERPYILLSGLESLCIVDAEVKASFPVDTTSIRHGQAFTDREDRDRPDRREWLEAHQDRLVEILGDLRRFHR